MMNEDGDGTPAAVLRRFWLRFREGAHSGPKMCPLFGISPDRCAAAGRYVRRGASDVKVWLFCVGAPDAETAALCDRVFVSRGSLALFAQAQRDLWPRWVALTVSTWTGEHGRWLLKLAPFLIPPFRTLL